MEVVSIGKAAPVKEVVDLAEDILAAAKSGELRSLLYLAEVEHGTAVRYASTHTENRYQLLGFIARIAHKIQTGIDK